MMNYFMWDDRFRTGNAAVDEETRQLFDIISRVGAMAMSGDDGGDDALQQVFAELQHYVNFHCAGELQMMREAGVASATIAAHGARHHAFGEQLALLMQSRANKAQTAEALHGWLTTWLAVHVFGEDQAVARQIDRIKMGIDGDAAAAAEIGSDDTRVAVLLEGMRTLYGTIARQNRELDAANQVLEEKVVERTRMLLQAEKLVSIGQLASGFAHEINNPIGFVNSNLNSLGIYTDQLMRLAKLGAATPAGKALAAEIDFEFIGNDLAELLEESRGGLERVRKIVCDLKDFARVGVGAWQEADLLKGLDSTINVVWNELKYKSEIVLQLSPLPHVRCVPAEINQVLMNFLINSVQSIEVHGIITVRSGQVGERVWLEVIDTGSGMDDVTRQRVFDPFFTTKPVGVGRGLGLTVAWGIVQKHGGTIDVTSQLGSGSSFRVWLPVAGPSPLQVANEISRVASGGAATAS